MAPNGVNTFKTLRNHEEYYLSSGDLFLLVDNYHFRVHRYFFERESRFFQYTLGLPVSPGSVKQGTSETNAILLEDVTAQELSKFLWVFYNPKYSLYHASVDDWTSILKLAEKWTFPEVKALCIRELEQLTMPDIDRIVTYHLYNVSEYLLVQCYANVISREQPLSIEEGRRMGIETALKISTARECARSPTSPIGVRSPTSCKLDPLEMETLVRDQFGLPQDPPPHASPVQSVTQLATQPAPPPPPTPSKKNPSATKQTLATPVTEPVVPVAPAAPPPPPVKTSLPSQATNGDARMNGDATPAETPVGNGKATEAKSAEAPENDKQKEKEKVEQPTPVKATADTKTDPLSDIKADSRPETPGSPGFEPVQAKGKKKKGQNAGLTSGWGF